MIDKASDLANDHLGVIGHNRLGCACDIRDKYIQGSFMWDLGVKYEDYIE